MQPIFTEKEENEVYEATIMVITDKGVSIREDFSIRTTAKNYENEKASGLKILHDRFSIKLNTHK